jgi:predicted DNA-binding transcriptional regulator YafY
MASKLVKLLKALDLLSRPSGVTIKEISENLGIDRRSVYRLMETIEELHIPTYEDKNPAEKEKRWKLVESYVKKLPNLTFPDISLTLPEIISLYLLKGESGIFQDTEIRQRIDSAFAKLAQVLPDRLCEQIDRVKTIFVPLSKYGKDYSGKQEIIDCCTDAMLRRRTCYAKYHSFSDDRIKNFKIDPLCFFENNGGLYIFIRATSFDAIRILAVERIHELQMTDSTFEPPPDFDPKALLESSFDIIYDDPLEVKIWFSADQARYVKERTWAKDQNFTDQADGSVILQMSTSGWLNVKKWVLSFGAEARVLEPEKLATEVIDELRKTFDAYSTSTG